MPEQYLFIKQLYVFRDSAHAEGDLLGMPGNIYSRLTILLRNFLKRIAALEGIAALAVASGAAALTILFKI